MKNFLKKVKQKSIKFRNWVFSPIARTKAWRSLDGQNHKKKFIIANCISAFIFILLIAFQMVALINGNMSPENVASVLIIYTLFVLLLLGNIILILRSFKHKGDIKPGINKGGE